MNERQLRIVVALVMTGVALIWVTLLHFLLPEGSLWSRIFTARGYDSHYPVSVQNVEWLVFFIALGELWVRGHRTNFQMALLKQRLLPEDETTMLRAQDLGPIYAKARSAPKDSILARLIRRLVLQYRTSKNASETQSLLNSSLDLYMHEVDLIYSRLRYLMWLLPSLGFLGTVQGVGEALAKVGRDSANKDLDPAKLLPDATASLAVAFDTTQVALLMAGFLMLIMNLVQAKEEHLVNQTGQYCLDNLINRLCEPQTVKS